MRTSNHTKAEKSRVIRGFQNLLSEDIGGDVGFFGEKYKLVLPEKKENNFVKNTFQVPKCSSHC